MKSKILGFKKMIQRFSNMTMLDTTQYKGLIGNFVSNLELEVLSFVAEQEREIS